MTIGLKVLKYNEILSTKRRKKTCEYCVFILLSRQLIVNYHHYHLMMRIFSKLFFSLILGLSEFLLMKSLVIERRVQLNNHCLLKRLEFSWINSVALWYYLNQHIHSLIGFSHRLTIFYMTFITVRKPIKLNEHQNPEN